MKKLAITLLLLCSTVFAGDFTSDMLPTTTNFLDVGSLELQWKDAYGDGTLDWDTITDGTFSITAGVGTGLISLTDGTASWSSSSLSAFINGTFSGTLTAGTFTDGTATLTGGNLTGMGNITGSDVDISAGTGDYSSTGTMSIGALTATSLTASGLTATRVIFAGTGGLLSDDSDMTFATDTLTVTKLGAFEAAGAINFATQNMTNVDIDSGTVDGITTLGLANSVDVGNYTITANGLTIDGAFTDGTTSITGGNYTGVGNITGSDVDISGGTGSYTASGNMNVDTNVFNVDTTSDIVGVGIAADSSVLLRVADTRSESASFSAIAGASTLTPTSAGLDFTALDYQLNLGVTSTNLDSLVGVRAKVVVLTGYTGTITEVCGFETNADFQGAAKDGVYTIDDYSQLVLLEPAGMAGSATINTMYGIKAAAITDGTTNWFIHSSGGDSYYAGDIAFGQTDKAERIGSDSDGTLDLYAGTSIEFHDATNIGDGTNELQVSGTGVVTLAGGAIVYNELPPTPITAAKLGSTAPTLTTFKGNIEQYIFDASNDYVIGSTEVTHAYMEGSDIHPHIHWATNGTEGTAKAVKWQLEYSIADMDGTTGVGDAFGNAVTISAELAIPLNTPDRTHMYTNLDDITGTNIHIGNYIVWRLTRIVAAGTAPVADPFGIAVGFHVQNDELGSFTETTK